MGFFSRVFSPEAREPSDAATPDVVAGGVDSPFGVRAEKYAEVGFGHQYLFGFADCQVVVRCTIDSEGSDRALWEAIGYDLKGKFMPVPGLPAGRQGNLTVAEVGVLLNTLGG